MVAITVVLAAVLYVLVAGLVGIGERPKTIGIACTKIGNSNSKCTIANSDNGVDFTQVTVQVQTSEGNVVARWTAGFSLSSGSKENDTALPPVFSGRIVDNGDGDFGVGDDIFIVPVAGTGLSGLTLKISGDKSDGSAPIP